MTLFETVDGETVSTIEIDVDTGNCFKRNIYRVRNE